MQHPGIRDSAGGRVKVSRRRNEIRIRREAVARPGQFFELRLSAATAGSIGRQLIVLASLEDAIPATGTEVWRARRIRLDGEE